MKKQEFPRKTVVLTFDDGDYELYYLVLPILKKYGFKGAAFVIGSYVKESTEVYNDSAVEYYIGKDLINKTEIDYPNIDVYKRQQECLAKWIRSTKLRKNMNCS